MPFKKSMYKKKRPYKRPKTISAMAKRVSQGVGNYYFRRMGTKPDVVGATPSVAQYGSFTFQLQDLPSFNEFTNLYDQYMLEKVELHLKLFFDPSAQSAGNAVFPMMYYRVDYDDDGTPASIDEFRQVQTTKICVINPNRFKKITIKPKILQSLYNPTVNAYSPKSNAWIDCSYANAPHFGFKYAIARLPPGMVLTFDTVYHVRFKDPR